ncbi:glycosyltransferase [Marinobacterium sp. MBR-109]|jgi:glycosyltransferase involved in cell wall biosynthesis|uniref:glycosyltransferase n=1 Tax=Marinobacterium sp. MBR-109 TaxID=3156462 RepID=UPI0033914FD4
MKIAFFQPYMANWRIQFLEYFINKSKHEIIVYDGGFSSKKDDKSVTGNNADFNFHKFISLSFVFEFRGQPYPVYFSPFLFFRLIIDRPDVIVTEGEINFINNFSIWLYCILFDKKYVWWSLGKVITRKKNVINKLLDPFVNFLLFRSSCVMARNSQAKKYYLDKGIPDERIIVAPNSMDDERALREVESDLLSSLIKKKGSRKVILYVGALVSTKRPADLIDMLEQHVNKLERDYELWYVGAGPIENDLKRRVVERGLDNRVRFFGKVFDGVGSYFSVADVVVVPGLGGLVINHAMIFGTPVVSRPADGTEKDLIIDGITGYIVNDYDNSALAMAVDTLLCSENSAEMRQQVLSHVQKNWNIKIMYDRAMECIMDANATPIIKNIHKK